MPRLKYSKILLFGGILLTAFLLWYSIANYRSSLPVAQSILRGMSLSLGQAIESVVSHDQSFKALSDFNSRDVAFFSVIDQSGLVRFHSNSDLIGETVTDSNYQQVFVRPAVTEDRIRLGTGEVVFETQQQLHISGSVFVLRLALHTWQADQIILRARTGMLVVSLLVAAAWGMGLLSWRLQQRDLQRSVELNRHEHLARLGELGAVMAHEVRTPLAGIKGFAQLLREQLEDPRKQQYADTIVIESRRLEELVDDLLVYARQEFPEGVAGVEETVIAAWNSLAAMAQKSGAELRVVGSIDRLAACPSERLYQVLLNLFSNAIQAMPGKGELLVNLSCDLEIATLMIVDNGPGFTVDSLKRAFDPFFTTRSNGSGLGLAVCRKIVEAYGGTIELSNGSNGGAEVIVRLPLAKEQT